MKSILIVVCMAATAAAQAKAVKPQQEGPAPRPDKASLKPKLKDGAVDVQARVGTEFAWDDNILDLNEKQISQLESGNRPDKYRIDEPGDFIYSVWAEVRVKGRIFREPTSAGLKIQPYYYQDSSIANYEEYKLFLHQDLGAHEAGIDVGFERDVYLRELEIVVPGPNLWESASYDEYDVSAYYQHRLHAAVTLRGSLGWLIRDFESPFGYRDRAGWYLAIKPELALGRGWSAFLRYEYADQEAEPDALDADTSYLQHEVEIGAAVALVPKALDLSLSYRLGFRDYTSSQPLVVDPSHVDREDRRQRVVLEVKWKIAKSWAVEGRYEWKDVDSDRPFDNNATTSEPGDSTRNVFSLGVTFSL